MGTLSYLKSSLEYDEMAEFEGLSVEEAARRKFAKDRIRAANRESGGADGISVIDDVQAQKVDISNTIALLEKKLADVKAMESKEGLDLSELRARISGDLAKAKKRLHAMK